MIGKHEQSAAFVYGAYSFLDKLANGVLLFFITAYAISDPVALRWIIALVPIACGALALFLTYLGQKLYSGRMAKLSVGNSLRAAKPKNKNWYSDNNWKVKHIKLIILLILLIITDFH